MSLFSNLKKRFVEEEEDNGLSFGLGDEFNFRINDDKDIKIVSDVEKISDVDVKYPLIKPFAYAHIKWDPEEKTVLYRVIEPKLSEEDEEMLSMIKENLSEKIDVSLSSMNGRDKIIDYLQKQIKELLMELGIALTDEQHKKVLYFIYRDFVGIGRVEPLMHDPYIEDLGCDGTGTPIFAVHSEFGSVKTSVVYNDQEELENLVIKLAERAGRYVSYANPLLDGALPDGSRVNASLTEDVTSHGPTFSIRKFQDTPFSAIDVVDLGTASPKLMAYLWICQQYRQSVLVCGGTATGKTSFLNATISFIPPEDKIVSIEDTRELQLPHENWIPSVTREMFGSQQHGDVDMDDLLKESFRQNPDYVVVGEVRGEEASVLFQGMSSGHPSMGTMHASSPNAVVKRLTTPPISLSPALVEAIDVMVVMTHAKGVEKSARRVKAVHEMQTVIGESSSARTNEAFTWTAMDDTHSQRGEPYLFDQISNDYGISKQKLNQELENRAKLIKWLKQKNVKEFDKVSEIIAEYYKNKEDIVKMVNSESGDYTLDQIIESEKRIDLSRPKRLESDMKREIEKNKEKKEEEEINEDTPIKEKVNNEENPIEELEKRLKSEEENIENIRNNEINSNPFESDEDEEIEENPFEA